MRRRRARAATVAVLVVMTLLTPAFGATLSAVKERGLFLICAHPDALPFSSQNPSTPGFQVEIASAIAAQLGVRLQVDWIVFARHARQVDCDAIIGSVVASEVKPRRGVTNSKPYARSGYVLVVPAANPGVRSLDDLKNGKVGVEHQSWPHYLLSTRHIPTGSYGSQTDILDALAAGEVRAGLVTESYLGWYLKEHPGAALKVADGYTPEPELRWEVAVGLRNTDRALVDAVNQILDRLIDDGTLRQIFARYGVTYAPPALPSGAR